MNLQTTIQHTTVELIQQIYFVTQILSYVNTVLLRHKRSLETPLYTVWKNTLYHELKPTKIKAMKSHDR